MCVPSERWTEGALTGPSVTVTMSRSLLPSAPGDTAAPAGSVERVELSEVVEVVSVLEGDEVVVVIDGVKAPERSAAAR